MAASITERRDSSYIQESSAWGSDAEDMLAIAYYRLGERDKALVHAARALMCAPHDERLIRNIGIIAGGA
jgi:Flp pilus assembly protein TadD